MAELVENKEPRGRAWLLFGVAKSLLHKFKHMINNPKAPLFWLIPSVLWEALVGQGILNLAHFFLYSICLH